jgi:cell division initiation protein
MPVSNNSPEMSSITPVEVRHAQLGRGLFGYSRSATDNLLEAIAQSYEQTWWERADLRDEVERLQAELARFRDMERLLRDTMMSAEKAAEDVRGQARREYDLLLQEARLKAREIVMESEAEREKVRSEIRSLRSARSELRSSYRSFLQTALERLDTELDEAPPAIEAASGPSENGAPRELEAPDDDASDTESPTHAT